VANLPIWQRLHDVEPAVEKEPAAQNVVVVAPMPLVAPVIVLAKEPAGEIVQAAEPATEEKKPKAQRVDVVAPLETE